MTPVWKRLRRDDPAYRLEANDNGYLLVRNAGQGEAFNRIVRSLLDTAGEEFVAFPTSDGPASYERLFVIPMPDHVLNAGH